MIRFNVASETTSMRVSDSKATMKVDNAILVAGAGGGGGSGGGLHTYHSAVGSNPTSYYVCPGGSAGKGAAGGNGGNGCIVVYY